MIHGVVLFCLGGILIGAYYLAWQIGARYPRWLGALGGALAGVVIPVLVFDGILTAVAGRPTGWLVRGLGVAVLCALAGGITGMRAAQDAGGDDEVKTALADNLHRAWHWMGYLFVAAVVLGWLYRER